MGRQKVKSYVISSSWRAKERDEACTCHAPLLSRPLKSSTGAPRDARSLLPAGSSHRYDRRCHRTSVAAAAAQRGTRTMRTRPTYTRASKRCGRGRLTRIPGRRLNSYNLPLNSLNRTTWNRLNVELDLWFYCTNLAATSCIMVYNRRPDRGHVKCSSFAFDSHWLLYEGTGTEDGHH